MDGATEGISGSAGGIATPAAVTPPAAPATPPAGSAAPPAAPPAAGAPDTKAGEQPPAPKAGETPPAEFKVPDEYKDKPWATKVKSMDDLYKQIDTLDALKGKKTIVPDLAKATPEEKEAYYAQLRPKDLNEYKFTDITPIDPEIDKGVRDLLSKNGVSAVQGNEIIKGYQEIEDKLYARAFDPEGYKEAMKTAFGAEWEKSTTAVRTQLKGMMGPDDSAMLDHLPNAYLGLIYRTLGNVQKHYGVKETDQAHLGPGGKTAATDIAGVRQGLRDQLSALSQKPHTVAEKNALITKINDTYKNDPRLTR